jgi:hypothetical protein
VSTWAIALCAVLYVITAADLFRDRQYGLALAFAAYALANVGLILAARK